MRFSALAHAAVALALCALAACSSDGGGAADASVPTDVAAVADAAPADVAPDAGEEDVPPVVHAITSATPGVAAARLGASHPGYGKADCTGCHVDPHGGRASPDCAVCHGSNGAPDRPAGHADGGCAACHAGAHDGLGFASAGCIACHGYAPWPADGCATTERPDVVVVGAGGGGLAAAATVARAGHTVALLEQHNKVGGCMTNFWRGDYRFEVSLHAMGGFDEPSTNTRDLFERLGILDRVVPVRAEPMYRAVFPDFTFDVPADMVAYERDLIAKFPQEEDGITRLFALFRDVHEALGALTAYQQGDRAALDALLREKPEVMGRILGYMDATLATILADYITDPQLLALFAQLACYAGAEPQRLSGALFAAMWIGYHLGGFYNFVGGSESVSEALADVVRENGGTVRLQTRATTMDVEEGRIVRVRTEDGVCYEPQAVVSNASAPGTLALVGRENVPEEWAARIDGGAVALSVFVVYLGVDADYAEVFGGTHELLVQDEYDMDAPVVAGVECALERSILLVTNYSAIDPTAAPAGKSAITITGALDYDCRERWGMDDRERYAAVRDEVARTVIARAERVLPGLSRHVEVLEVGAPQTIEAFTSNPRGTIYGFDPVPSQSLMKRLPQETPVPNLFLAGAWTFPGPGQSAVLQSGESAAKLALELLDAE